LDRRQHEKKRLFQGKSVKGPGGGSGLSGRYYLKGKKKNKGLGRGKELEKKQGEGGVAMREGSHQKKGGFANEPGHDTSRYKAIGKRGGVKGKCNKIPEIQLPEKRPKSPKQKKVKRAIGKIVPTKKTGGKHKTKRELPSMNERNKGRRMK